MDVDKKIADAYREHLNVTLPDAASLKIRAATHAELERSGGPHPKSIMTMEEAAAYLRVNVTDVEAYLGDIPCFEFAGKLRFRKEAVDSWIQRREHLFASDIIHFRARDERKLVIV